MIAETHVVSGIPELHIVGKKNDKICKAAEYFKVGDRLVGEICYDGLTKEYYLLLRKE